MSDRAPPPARSGRSFGGSVVLSWVFVGLMSAMALGNNIAIARVAGPDGRGLYGVAVAIVALALPVLSLGLGSAATFHVGQGIERGRVSALNHLASLALVPLSAGVVAIVGALEGGPPGTTATLAVATAALVLPAQVYVDLAKGWYLGQKRALAYNLVAALVIGLLLLLNLTTLRFGTHWVLLNFVVANWIVTVGLLATQLVRWREFVRPGLAFVRRSIAYGSRASLIALADAALLRVDYLIMTPILGIATVGIYAIADQITHLMSWAGLVAGRMMLAESSSDQGGDQAFDKLGLACRAMIPAMLGASALAAATLWWLVPAVFGARFADAYWGVLILLPAALCKSLHALLSTYLAGRGVQNPVVTAGVVAVLTDVVLATVGALTLGWLGVAAAKSVSYAVQLGWVQRALARHRPDDRMRWILDRADLRRLRAFATRLLARRRGLGAPDDAR
ncbi:MAG: lipopolysaccharide biosynthesis protein [Myxococcota bacterium]